jgi:hypothetical protein
MTQNGAQIAEVRVFSNGASLGTAISLENGARRWWSDRQRRHDQAVLTTLFLIVSPGRPTRCERVHWAWTVGEQLTTQRNRNEQVAEIP